MKTFRLFSMAALALAMAACSNNDDNEILQNTQQPGTMHFTATIAAPSGDATTRTAYTEVGKTINVTWEVDDEIALVHNGVVDVAKVTAVDGSGNATIEATITGSPADNDDVYLAYPADAVFSATPYKTFHFTPNPDIFDKVKNYQDGTLEYIQNNLDLRTGDGKLAVSGDKVTLKESVSIPSIICIWKLTLQDESSNPLSATQLTFKNETYTQAKATSAAKNEYYLCVVPGYIPAPAGTYSFEATVGGDTYTFSKTDLNLTAGKYYKSTVKMAKAGPTAYTLAESTVGMIVGTDGKAYAVADKDNLPSGVTAVAMVAYKSGSNGLAIQLNSSPVQKNWADAKTYAEGLTAITGGTWRLPSKADWQNMFVGCAVSGDASSNNYYMTPIAGFKAKIAATGITWQSVDYWSSTDILSNAWIVGVYLNSYNAYAAFDEKDPSLEFYVLGCLAF